MLRLTVALAALLLAVIVGSASAADDGQSVSAQVQEQRGPADRGDGGEGDDQGGQEDETGGGDETGGQDDETVDGEGDGEGDVLGEREGSDPGAGGDGGTDADDVAEEDDGGSLPFTGLEIALIAFAGVLFLLLGVAVRERARRPG